MTREEFKTSLESNVRLYIDNFYRFGSNPQLRIIPATLAVTLVDGSEIGYAVEDNDEAVEYAAAAHGMANQEGADYQVTRNPDYYAVKPLLKATSDDKTVPDEAQIESIVSNYFDA